jgi:hypothetical protein
LRHDAARRQRRDDLTSSPIVAELRYCADEKLSARIVDCARTKTRPYAIGDPGSKQIQSALAFINNRVFCTDVLFIRTENMVDARSAQCPLLIAG